MHKSRLWRGTAIAVAACGMIGAGAGTAVAASATPAAPAAPTITITTKSAVPKVGGDTLVVFLGPSADRTATVSGSVTGVTQGDQATLLARPFGGATYSPAGPPATLTPVSGTAPYSFKVTPNLATSYEVQVSGADVTTPVTSAARSVYVTPLGTVTGKKPCSRPVCHIKLRVWVKVPSRAYATEAAKHWYLYSRLKLSRSHEPPAPKVLELNRSATASKQQKLHSYEFVVTIRYALTIGSDAYRYAVNFCTKDSEATDGIGLPGSHGCGNKWISATQAYLG